MTNHHNPKHVCGAYDVRCCWCTTVYNSCSTDTVVVQILAPETCPCNIYVHCMTWPAFPSAVQPSDYSTANPRNNNHAQGQLECATQTVQCQPHESNIQTPYSKASAPLAYWISPDYHIHATWKFETDSADLVWDEFFLHYILPKCLHPIPCNPQADRQDCSHLFGSLKKDLSVSGLLRYKPQKQEELWGVVRDRKYPLYVISPIGIHSTSMRITLVLSPDGPWLMFPRMLMSY